MEIIEIVFLLLGGGLVAVTVLRYLKLPILFGYLIVGVLVGPHGMKLIDDSTNVASLAELGIMALMFTLGLKFSITRLQHSKRIVLGLGGLQMGVCLGIVTALAAALFDFDWRTSLLVGSIVAMSSTAVVSNMLIERAEVGSPHGTRSIAVLIFQDLAVIPLLVLFASADTTAENIALDLLYAAVLIALLILVAPRIMPSVVRFFSHAGSSEVFTIFVLCFIVGTSLLTYSAGLSLVLGSFVAGMLLAESHYRYLVEDIIRPYSEVFLSFFFVSIGLLVVPADLLANWPAIIIGTCAVLLGKPLVIFALTKLMGSHRWTAVHTAVALGGTGEFGFVLLTAAAGTVAEPVLQVLLGINLLCMVSPALLLPLAENMRAKWFGDDWLLQARDLTKIIHQTADTKGHVILSGYGKNCRIICALLDRHNIPWIAIENNHERAQAGDMPGRKVVFGDARNSEVLLAAGIAGAKALIITHGLHAQTVKTAHIARQLNAKLPIIAKALGSDDAGDILQAGATHVITAALETGSGLAIRAMQIYGLDNDTILSSIYMREGGEVTKDSDMLPTVASALLSSAPDSSDFAIGEIAVEAGGRLVGLTREQLAKALGDCQAKVLWVQRGSLNIQPDSTFALQVDDVLFLEGSSRQLRQASASLNPSKA